MDDTGVKGRVKGLLGAVPSPNEPVQQVADPRAEPPVQHEALQILDLAQRTADDYIVGARREADRICADARAQADQIVRDAQAHGQARHRDAEKALGDAQAKAEQVARDVQSHADRVKREADGILGEARTRANKMAKNAQANAEELEHQAQQRFDDVVGSLATKREALQSQIEALEAFDREYRGRLTAFLQNHLRALWVEQPQVDTGEIEQPVSPPTAQPAKAQHAKAQPAKAEPSKPAA